jgi:hypothetical protein
LPDLGATGSSPRSNPVDEEGKCKESLVCSAAEEEKASLAGTAVGAASNAKKAGPSSAMEVGGLASRSRAGLRLVSIFEMAGGGPS